MYLAEDDRLIVKDLDLDTYNNWGLWLTDFEDESPQTKTYTVEIPAGNGVIDLTETLAGDAAYGQGKQTLEFTYPELDGFQQLKAKIKNAIHGRRFEYVLSFDPEYTYSGRFSVFFSENINEPFGIVTIEIDRDPFKSKGVKTYKLNANGGNVYRFESGRKRVRPTFECSNPTIIEFNGREIMLPQGSYQCPDVIFERGWNEIYVNSMPISLLTWDQASEGGEHQMTWDEAESFRWFELEKLGVVSDDIVGMTWDDLSGYRWGELSAKTWNDITYTDAGGRNFTTFIEYEWSDL